jgi:hypothetical protein
MGAPFSYMECYGLLCGRKYIPICAIDAAIGKSEFTKDRVKNRIMGCNTGVHDFTLCAVALPDEKRNTELVFWGRCHGRRMGIDPIFAQTLTMIRCIKNGRIQPLNPR